MFLLQAVLLVLLPVLGASFVLLSILAFVIVSCYGGGFGTMPAFSADYFGSANVGKIYGLMLTAWSFGGVLGPLLISRVIDSTDSYSLAFFILAGIMAASAIVAFIVRPPRRGSEATAPQPEGARA
jgi:MFS transporter, OFA family, oxalate/formate antiporter